MYLNTKLVICLTTTLLFASSCAKSQVIDNPDNAVLVKDFSIQYRADGNEKIYYSYRDRHNPDIFIKPEMGVEINLTKSESTWDIEPSYSFDSKKIVYSSGTSMAQMDLRIMDADGSNNNLLYADPLTAVGAKWSPDNMKIAFSSIDRKKKFSNIYVINADGSGLKNLTDDLLGTAISPSWSSDGSAIIFVHGETQDGQHDIYKMAANGHDKTRLTDTEIFEAGPVYTPDGTTIVYSAQLGDHSQLFAISAKPQQKGETGKQLTNEADKHAYMASFSPNGAHLIYSSGDWQNGFSMAHLPVPRAH